MPSFLFSSLLLLLATLSSVEVVHGADADDVLVFLPSIRLQMRCSYDIRPAVKNMTADMEAYFLTILPKESISKWQIDGFPSISGQENVWPPCEYESTKTITTAHYSGYAYLAADANITEEELADQVTSDSLYEYFFRNVCQYEIEDWVAVINDPTFATTTNGRLICPNEVKGASAGVIVASVVGALAAVVLLFVGYRYYRKSQQ
mmetsp:Transcript_29289/g.48408  ORF Transcript_29289/g.48408 Transcript_29289/m.48408 type:complete len:205 (-) Transcript_29289:52-666(-)|eukprot:CAMPEP_0119003126 /NCGR_PEP_ID=MMETSP1176-20130426/371_1 /TAXON_ID=265551 /ORGANISM="Synedropsis recta cf, Strain CCMP1620" /LENGTH=204 /DNA_ID=CAMNT_0006954695 /DNA_START=142 /DNA_END=756 /DNA_ORIENTATION=-